MARAIPLQNSHVRAFIGVLAKRLRRFAPEGHFSRGMFLLVSGTAGSQLILALSSPILTRLYEPSDFGLLGVYSSVIAIIAVFSSLKYEQAITLPKNRARGYDLVLICIVATVVISILAWAVLYGLKKYSHISIFSSSGGIGEYLWVVPFGVLLSGIYTTLNYLALRNKRFGLISKTKFVQSILALVVQLGLYAFGAIALIFGQIVGSSAGTLSLAKSGWQKNGRYRVRISNLFGVLWHYRKFPIYTVPTNMLNTLGRQLPLLLIAGYISPYAAGLYALSIRIVQGPMSLVTTAISQVFLSLGPDSLRAGTFDQVVSDVIRMSLRTFAAPLAILAAISPTLFPLVFGENWQQAGVIAAVLTPWFLVTTLVSPISSVALILNKQDQLLFIEMLLALLRIGGLLIGLEMGNLILAVSLFSLGAVVGITLKGVWILLLAGVDIGEIAWLLMRELLFVAILYIGCMLALYSTGQWGQLAVASSLSIILARRSFIALKGGVSA